MILVLVRVGLIMAASALFGNAVEVLTHNPEARSLTLFGVLMLGLALLSVK